MSSPNFSDKQQQQSDPTSYRLVSLNDESGTVRIVNNPSGGIIIGTNSDLPSLEQNSDSNIPPGQKVFINNQGRTVYTKNERIEDVSSPGSQKVNSPAVVAPTSSQPGPSGEFKNPRDDARRKQHNEVERRRRDKINTWIARLAKIVPECSDEAKSSQSKGGILAKAHQHILNLQRDNQELVKKINSTPLIPTGASPDEAYAIQLSARDNEIQRLQRELKEAHDDRDDIIEQLKQQGITESEQKNHRHPIYFFKF